MGYDLARVTEQARNTLDALANARRELSELQTVCHRERRGNPLTQGPHSSLAASLTEAYQGAWDAEGEISIMDETLAQWLRRWEYETRHLTKTTSAQEA